MDKGKTIKILKLLIHEEDEGITRCFNSPDYTCNDIYTEFNEKNKTLRKDFDDYLIIMQNDNLVEIDKSLNKNIHATEKGLKYLLSNNL